jgi:hypothetical protein
MREKDDRFRNFSGWEVTFDSRRNSVYATKPDPRGGKPLLVIWSGANLHRNYLLLRRDAFREDWRVSGDPELEQKARAAEAMASVLQTEEAATAATRARQASEASCDPALYEDFLQADHDVVRDKMKSWLKDHDPEQDDHVFRRLQGIGMTPSQIARFIEKERGTT